MMDDLILNISQWMAEICNFIHFEVHVDVCNVLIDVHGDVHVVHVDFYHDGYNG